MKLKIILTLEACAVFQGVLAQNLLTNGDFNLPNSVVAPTGWNLWTYANTAGNAWANRANDAYSFDGSYYMQVGSDENGTSGAGLYQIVPGMGGYAYTLSVNSAVQKWWWPQGEIRFFSGFIQQCFGPICNVGDGRYHEL